MGNTKEDIRRMVEEEDVEFIRLQFTDIYGQLKNMAITASQLERALDNKCSFNGAAIGGFIKDEEEELFLYPDLDTFTIFPWRPQNGKVARLICDLYRPNGEPYEGDPRYILKKAIAKAKDMGYCLEVGAACEFFLFHTDENTMPTTMTHEKAGYFDISPLDFGENARRDIVLTLEDMGFTVESSHHEAAPAQHEIDFTHADALTTADDFTTFRMVVKTIAKRHGLHATFMPKPKADEAGSGLHVNMALYDGEKNVFFDSSDAYGLSKTGYHFAEGILKHVKGMTLTCNPLVNSYKRLISGSDAPSEIACSNTNRKALLRVKKCDPCGVRLTLRSPDPSANPYLVIAQALMAGLEGIRTETEASDPSTLVSSAPAGVQADRLPATLCEAVEELKKDSFVQEVLGEHITEEYITTKSAEWQEYTSRVSEWEIEKYLLMY
ncbi:MAG: glutamine synthetase family protein [Lachnospiraceae bacterium]|nr:glutamine synthetase family protein [Lachnospiraceae bacterium]